MFSFLFSSVLFFVFHWVFRMMRVFTFYIYPIILLSAGLYSTDFMLWEWWLQMPWTQLQLAFKCFLFSVFIEFNELKCSNHSNPNHKTNETMWNHGNAVSMLLIECSIWNGFSCNWHCSRQFAIQLEWEFSILTVNVDEFGQHAAIAWIMWLKLDGN